MAKIWIALLLLPFLGGCQKTASITPLPKPVPRVVPVRGEANKLDPGIRDLEEQNRDLAKRAAELRASLREGVKDTAKAVAEVERLQREIATRPITPAELKAIHVQLKAQWLREQWWESAAKGLEIKVEEQKVTIQELEGTVTRLKGVLIMKDGEVANLRRSDADHRAVRTQQEEAVTVLTKDRDKWKGEYEGAKVYKYWVWGLAGLATTLLVAFLVAEYYRRQLKPLAAVGRLL